MSNKYNCLNGCILPKRKKQLIQDSSGEYFFGYRNFRFCPCCGALMPQSIKKLQTFFDVYDLYPALNKAKRLLFKSEYEAAARESFVVLENAIRKKAGLPNLHGRDLVAKAFSMEIDKQNGTIAKVPLILLNELKTESQRNEQEGIKMMLMGFFQGPRNLYQHNSIGTSVNMTMSIVMEASFFLYLVEGDKSLLKNGRWIPKKISYQDVYENMPKKTDRIKLIWMLKHKQGYSKKHGVAETEIQTNGQKDVQEGDTDK